MSTQPVENPVEETEAPVAPEPVEPAQAPDAKAAEGKVIELRTQRGALTLRPDQADLDSHQRAALVAIGIDVKADPMVQPHVRPFIHMCQVRGLDPWAREAYLIGRGRGEYRKYTMQVGIDGYRKMAAGTGRFLRVKEVLWTGQDDDDRSYYRDDRGIMRRVWYDQWPASRGYPGAAKVIIEHLEPDMRTVTETEAIADWTMYAPFTAKTEWVQGKKRKVLDSGGKEILELNDMWEKGYAHMLAKCAEALAHRKAFPNTMNGVYVHEEMHRADQIEQDRVTRESRAKLSTAYVAATTPALPAAAPTNPEEAPATAPEQSGPILVGDAVGDVVDGLTPPQEAPEAEETPKAAPEVPAGDQVALLLAELAFQASVLVPAKRAEVGTELLARRQVHALGKPVEQFTVEELLNGVVAPLRTSVASKLRETGRGGDAAAYGDVEPTEVVDVTDLFAPAPQVKRTDVDPHARHDYVGSGGGPCEVGGCERFEDELPHPPVKD